MERGGHRDRESAGNRHTRAPSARQPGLVAARDRGARLRQRSVPDGRARAVAPKRSGGSFSPHPRLFLPRRTQLLGSGARSGDGTRDHQSLRGQRAPERGPGRAPGGPEVAGLRPQGGRLDSVGPRPRTALRVWRRGGTLRRFHAASVKTPGLHRLKGDLMPSKKPNPSSKLIAALNASLGWELRAQAMYAHYAAYVKGLEALTLVEHFEEEVTESTGH